MLRLVGDVGEVEEGPDFDVLLRGVAHVPVLVDAVAVAATVALALDVSGLDQVGEDALCGSLGDPDLVGDVAEPDVGRAAMQMSTCVWLVRKRQGRSLGLDIDAIDVVFYLS